jgi:hypothetical protein
VTTPGRLFGTVLLNAGGRFFRDERYGAFFVVAGIGIGVVLIALIYRERIERWFWGIDRAHKIKSWGDRRRSKKKGGGRTFDLTPLLG